MEISPALEQFYDRRQRLLDALSTSGEAVNDWYQQLKEAVPTLRDLATLEALLAERKSQLDQLMKLDDDMLDKLVQARSISPPTA
jgi:ABC-type transporter Mla subunit MlaD